MDALGRRTLGRTGVEVAVLGYGSMELRGAPRGRDLDEAEVGALLGAVLDAGIDLIDTSIDYGLAEERIGRHLAHRRDEFFLASKCGCVVGWTPGSPEARGPHDYGRDNIVAGVEQSLRRLRTDRLDLLQVHLSPSVAVLEHDDVVATLHDLQAQGKVRFIGMSGRLPHLPDQLATGAFDVFQIPYSAVQRQHGGLIDEAARRGAGVIVRGGVAKGAPSGEAGVAERHADYAAAWRALEVDDLLDGMSPMEFALRFTISHPGMTSTIVGTASRAHLADNLAAARKGPLPPDVHAEAERRLDRIEDVEGR